MNIFYQCLRVPRKSCLLTLAVVFVVLWSGLLYFQVDKSRKVETKWYMKPAPCLTPESQLQDMAELAYLIHSVLDKLQVPHVLCFGTLWGALRNGAILPWDNNVDICVMNSEIQKASSDDLMHLLTYNGANVEYNSRYGYYEIVYKQAVGYINIFATKYSDSMYQIGWGRWFFFTKVQQFSIPSRFMEAPYPTAKFYGRQFPVPHEDIEILKYLYPSDWWLEAKPLGC